MGGPSRRIGVVTALSGRLAPLGEPVTHVIDLLGPRLLRGMAGVPIELLVRDSRSEPEGARAAAEALIREGGVDVVVTVGGSQVLPSVADTCERLAVPCVSTTLPWEVFYFGRGGSEDRPFRWTYQFCWGLGDIAAAFADLWRQVAPDAVVGCLWNDGTQGRALRSRGFVPVAKARGHRLVTEPAYRERSGDFGAQVDRFARDGVRVVTSAALASDLAVFLHQAGERGLRPALVTCSRWLTYPFWAGRHRLDGIGTIVSWTPWHEYRSSLDGSTAAELGASYERARGTGWVQPLGLAHAVVEIAAHALAHAEEPGDSASIAESLRRMRLDTMAGTFAPADGPVPNVSVIPLASGQWRAGDRPELAVVANTSVAAVPRTGELVLS